MRSTRLGVIAVTFATCFLYASHTAAQLIIDPNEPLAQTPTTTVKSGQYIVVFASGVSRSQRAEIARQKGAVVRFNYSRLNAIAVSVPNERAAEALSKHSAVLNMVADRVVSAHAPPSTPAAPGNLTATPTSNSVGLNWVDNSNNEEGFRIRRCTGSGCSPSTVVGTVGSGVTTFTDNSVSSSTTYGYQVAAFITSGPSNRREGISTTVYTTTLDGGEPPPPPPPPPPVSTGYTRQFIPGGVERVGVPNADSDGSGIGVAVLDSGLDYHQPDLNPAPDVPGTTSFNAFSSFSSAQDDHGHGTHVGGVIAALDNNIGVLGVAPNATLYGVKVLNAQGVAEDSEVIAGLDWVLANHDQVSPTIRVVNMSLGRLIEVGEDINDPNHPWRIAIQGLYDQGIVVVTSAGNDANYESTDHIPAAFSEVFAVAGTVTEHGGLDPACASFYGIQVEADSASYFTSDGPDITISAPSEHRLDSLGVPSIYGVDCYLIVQGVRSTTLIVPSSAASDPNTPITSRQIPAPSAGGPSEAIGTSFAAPHVAGVVARIMQLGLVDPTLAPSAQVEEIRNWIQSNADRSDSTPISPAGLLPVPLNQPYGPYSYDGVREGILQAPYPAP